jgi:PIN domain nuclease of toxin-antitoxin system
MGCCSIPTHLFAAAASHGIELMPISFADTTHLLTLPFHHRDPFDRLLIAQAIARQMVLVSADGEFGPYPVKRLWA